MGPLTRPKVRKPIILKVARGPAVGRVIRNDKPVGRQRLCGVDEDVPFDEGLPEGARVNPLGDKVLVVVVVDVGV